MCNIGVFHVCTDISYCSHYVLSSDSLDSEISRAVYAEASDTSP